MVTIFIDSEGELAILMLILVVATQLDSVTD